MSRFARIGEEAIKRQAELAAEEFRLYLIIVFHTSPAPLICAISLREISRIYELDYNNTTRRYKRLREKGWCEKTDKGIRPLVGIV